MLPRQENRVTHDPTRRDAWGIPVIRIECAHNQAEVARARDQNAALPALAEVANVKLLRIDDAPARPGRGWVPIPQTRCLILTTSAGTRRAST
jgi:hypothetical protein